MTPDDTREQRLTILREFFASDDPDDSLHFHYKRGLTLQHVVGAGCWCRPTIIPRAAYNTIEQALVAIEAGEHVN